MIGVTLLAVLFAYVGHERKVVQDRKAVGQWILDHDGWCVVAGDLPVPDAVERPSFIRRWMGDQTFEEVWFRHGVSQDDAKRIRMTFPGVRIYDVQEGEVR